MKNIAQKKILIIDDDPVITAISDKHFRADGFSVLIANSGKVGLNAVHDFRPDVVLLDLNMPDVNGVQWLDEVRKDPRFVQLPVVVFTAATVGWQVWAANNLDVSFVFKNGAIPYDVVKAANAAIGIPTQH